MNFHQDVVVHDLPDVGYGKKRFHAGGSVGDDRNRSRGCNGCHRCVAYRRGAFLVIQRSFKIRKCTARFGQRLRRRVTLVIDETHDFAGQFNGFLCVVRNTQLDQHVRPAHDTQSDFTVSHGHCRNLRQRIVIDLHNIVQKMYAKMNDFLETFPVNLAVLDHFAQIDGSQVA